MDVDMYIMSTDSPEEQKELYTAIVNAFGYSIPFLSDPKMDVIEAVDMKNRDVAYRGYALIDAEGNKVFHTINDRWGEQIDKTLDEIEKEYNDLMKD